MTKNLSVDDRWTHAAAAIEHVVGAEAPLVAAAQQTGTRETRGVRSLARPLGLSLFVACGVAIALALLPAPQPGSGSTQGWQSVRR